MLFWQEAKEFKLLLSNELPSGWADALPSPTPADKGKATRLHSQDNLNALASVIPGMPLSSQACPSGSSLLPTQGPRNPRSILPLRLKPV